MQGGGKWNASPLYSDVKSFQNYSYGNNTGKVGVYPVWCDLCTAADPNSPYYLCNPNLVPESPQTGPICNVQRQAIEKDCNRLITIKIKEVFEIYLKR